MSNLDKLPYDVPYAMIWRHDGRGAWQRTRLAGQTAHEDALRHCQRMDAAYPDDAPHLLVNGELASNPRAMERLNSIPQRQIVKALLGGSNDG